MSSNLDPVERGIERAGGAIAGALIAGLFGYAAGQRHKNSKKDFDLPTSLTPGRDGDDKPIRYSSEENQAKQFQALAMVGAVIFGSLVHGALSSKVISMASVLLFGSACIGCIAAAFYFARRNKQHAAERVAQLPERIGLQLEAIQVFTISLPKDSDWRPEQAGRFMQQILFKAGGLVFQIVAECDRITWRILDWQGGIEPSVIRQAVQAFYPDAEVSHSTVSEPEFDEPFYRLTRGVYQEQPFINPITYVSDCSKVDPLVNLVQEMNGLAPGEQVTYTLAVTEPARFVYQQAQDVLTTTVPVNPFDLGAVGYRAGAQADYRTSEYDEQDLKVYLAKLENQVYQSVMFLQVDAPSEARAWDLMALATHVAQ
jgi:hypothetical protein